MAATARSQVVVGGNYVKQGCRQTGDRAISRIPGALCRQL